MSDGRPGNTRWSPALLFALAALTLAVLNFSLSYIVAIALYGLRVFHQGDVWFNADANFVLVVFSQPPDGFNYRHPNLGSFVFPIVSTVAQGVDWLSPGPCDGLALREHVALLVAPAFGAIRTVALLAVFRSLLGRLLPAVLICVIDMFSVGSLVGGMVPESFGLTALCLAVMYWLAAGPTHVSSKAEWSLWSLTGVLAVGATITNIVPFIIMLGSRLLQRKVTLDTAARYLVVAIAVVIGGTALVAVLAGQMWDNPVDVVGAVENQPSFIALREATRIVDVMRAIGHTFIAPLPAELGAGEEWLKRNPDYHFFFGYPEWSERLTETFWRPLLTFALMAAGAVALVRAGHFHRRVAVPVLLLAFNVGVHLLFGDSLILYALHWQLALLVMISGVALLPKHLGDIALAAFALGTAANTIHLSLELFDRLREVVGA